MGLLLADRRGGGGPRPELLALEQLDGSNDRSLEGLVGAREGPDPVSAPVRQLHGGDPLPLRHTLSIPLVDPGMRRSFRGLACGCGWSRVRRREPGRQRLATVIGAGASARLPVERTIT